MFDAGRRNEIETPRRLGVAAIGGGFILAGLLGLLAVLERIGLTASLLAPLMIGLALAAFAGAGLLTRTMLLAQYEIAGRVMPVAANAVAIAAMLVGLVLLGRDPLATGLGAAAGLALAAWLVSRAMHASRALTLPERLGRRYGGLVRTLASLVVVIACFPALVAFVSVASLILTRTYALSETHAAEIIAVGLIAAGVFGGMRGVSMAQLAAAVAIAAACLTVGFLLLSGPAIPLPLVDALALGDERLVTALTAFVGTAVLPPVALRLATSGSRPEGRRAGYWAAAVLLVPVAIAAEVGVDAARAWNGSAVVVSLVEAAVLLAMLAGAVGFAFAIASTLANDIHHALISPQAPVSRRLIVARLILIAVIAASCVVAALGSIQPAPLMLWSLSIAGAGLLPLVVFGATKLRIGVFPAVAGMAAGIATALIELGAGVDLLAGESNAGAGLWGAIVGVIVMLAAVFGAAAARSVRNASAAGKPATKRPSPEREKPAEAVRPLSPEGVRDGA